MTQQPTIHPTTSEPTRYCRRCGYQLHGLTTPRCPECGRAFDPANPRTYGDHPPRRLLHYAKRVAFLFATLFVLLVVVWGWFFNGWYSEHRVLAEMRVMKGSVGYTTIISPWIRERLGAIGFVFDRAADINVYGDYGDAEDISPLDKLTKLDHLYLSQMSVTTDLSPLSRLTKIVCLHLETTPITKLPPLIRLTNLREIGLSETQLTDLSQLAGLINLQRLALVSTPVENLSPLVGLRNLKELNLLCTPVKDISPLAGLTKIEELNLYGTSVTDVSPLLALKSLRRLTLSEKSITKAQVDELHRTLPKCSIFWY